MNGEIRVVDDVAPAFTREVVHAFATRPRTGFVLVVSGGETARRCYEDLAANSSSTIDWWNVDVYWGDERCVPPDHPDSNERLVREALLSRVGAVNAYFPMRCEEGTDAYQMKIAHAGFFDLIHLGVGADGHTASLFPGSDALAADPGQLVVLNSDPNGRNPHRRMTLTLSAIARARHAVFTVSGPEKQAVMQHIYDGADLPASRVHADRVTWLVDRQAAPEQLRR
jgi:6-phosphogluconolactonase